MKPAASLWSFLTTARSLPGARRRAPGRLSRARARAQRGIALVTVLIAIAITLVISNEFGTTTNIDLIAAANYQDQMRSHFLARSASNLSELVIRLQQRIDNLPKEFGGGGQIQITDFADQVLLAFCGSTEEVQAAVGFDPSQAKGLGADIGTCGIVGQISTEDDKINVNCANGNNWATLKSVLDGLIYFQTYDPVFEDADAEGYRRDRATQVAAIIDYIDVDTSRLRDNGTTEDYGYENLKDPYRQKNGYLDTVGELKLVRGIDDRFWSLFGSAFTIYGGCTVNLSALSNVQLIAAVLQLAAANPSDPMLTNQPRLFALAGLIAKAKQFGMTFSSHDDFIEFVKDPQAAIGALAATQGSSTLAGSAAGAALTQGIPGLSGGDKLGLELDKKKLQQMTSVGPRRTYRVQAWGEIERKQKNADGSPVYPPIRSTVTGVWDTKVVPQNARKPPVPKGAWVFLRED